MKVETKIAITDITQDDLVNLFSTALYGSYYLGADYPNICKFDHDDCYEDRLAKTLLNGGSIDIIDGYAEGCVYGNLPHEFEKDEDVEEGYESVRYKVTLEDVRKGLEKAGSGKFKINFDGEEDFARRAFTAFVNEDGNFDLIYADCLMQIIVFGELIYG